MVNLRLLSSSRPRDAVFSGILVAAVGAFHGNAGAQDSANLLAANNSESIVTSAVASVQSGSLSVPSESGTAESAAPGLEALPGSEVLAKLGLLEAVDGAGTNAAPGPVAEKGDRRSSRGQSPDGSPVVFSDQPVATSDVSAQQTLTSTSPVIPRSAKLEEMGVDLSAYARIADPDQAPEELPATGPVETPPAPASTSTGNVQIPRVSGAELAPEAARQSEDAETAVATRTQPTLMAPAPAPLPAPASPGYDAAAPAPGVPSPAPSSPASETPAPRAVDPVGAPNPMGGRDETTGQGGAPVELPQAAPSSPLVVETGLPEQAAKEKRGFGGFLERFKIGRDRKNTNSEDGLSTASGETIPQPDVMADPGGVEMQGGAFASAAPASGGAPVAAPSAPVEDGETIAKVGVFPADFRASQDLEQQSDGVQRFPTIELPDLPKSTKEANIDWMIDQIASAYAVRVEDLNSIDVSLDVADLPSVPSDFAAPWTSRIDRSVWSREGAIRKGLDGIYASALQNSHQVATLSQMPLIRETGIQEAEGAFDFNAFIDGRYAHTDEPTGSLLDTGRRGRFEQDLWQGEYGLRKRFKTGAEVSVSNRLSTLDNNSEFLDPNPQAGSEIVLSITQPLLQGNGYHYNTMALKVAKLDAKMGVAEFVRQLETYLLELNRTYWGVYLSRASYLQKRSLMEQTEKVVKQLEGRAEVDEEATRSELLRARSALAQRKASLIRSEMAIRTAEQRLRALVNDPEYQLGSASEIIPVSAPIVSPPNEDVRKTAELAIANRPELLEGIYQVQAAGLRRDLQKNELLPSLDLILEGTVAGIDDGREVDQAFSDQFDHGEGWLAGFQFSMPLERNFAKARHTRRKQELQMQVSQLRSTLDSVLLEAVVAYQDLKTAYRDMQGKYQAVLASREELSELEERLDVDAGEEGGSVGYQLQLILDALERNEAAEQDFLVSVVVYNTSFTVLDRARGTLLRKHNVDFERIVDEEGVTVVRGSNGPVSGK